MPAPARRAALSLLALVAGGALALVPSQAASAPPSTGSFTAIDYQWEANGSSASSTVTIATGGTVSFGYPTGSSSHNADFGTGPQPSSCLQSAPAGASGTVPPLPNSPSPKGWAGSCTFSNAGTYTFHCDLHAFMTGTVVVQDPTTTTASTATTGTTTAGTATTTTGTAGTGTTPTGTTGTGTTATGTTGSSSGSGAGSGSGSGSGSGGGGIVPSGTGPYGPRAAGHRGGGRLVLSFTVAPRQRGLAVRFAVRLAARAAPAHLVATVSAPASELASAAPGRSSPRRGPALVGRLERRGVSAGRTRFAVALAGPGIQALHRRHRLDLRLELLIAGPHGRERLGRGVVLRA